MNEIITKKPFYISRENEIFVVTTRHFSIQDVNAHLSEIEKVLFHNGYRGKVLFDCLSCFGTNHNRFIYRNFNGFNFIKEEIFVACLTKIEIMKRNKIYLEKHREEAELFFGIKKDENKDTLEHFLNDDFSKWVYDKPTLRQLMDEIMFNSWGLRGDPHLWKDIKETYGKEIIELEDVEYHMIEWFFDLTGKTIDCEEHIYCEKYSHGGMSSGFLSSRFWKEKAIPALIERRKLYH